jgi:hypothetical protein
MSRPSGLNATPRCAVWPRKVSFSSPLAASQTFPVPSKLTEAMRGCQAEGHRNVMAVSMGTRTWGRSPRRRRRPSDALVLSVLAETDTGHRGRTMAATWLVWLWA